MSLEVIASRRYVFFSLLCGAWSSLSLDVGFNLLFPNRELLLETALGVSRFLHLVFFSTGAPILPPWGCPQARTELVRWGRQVAGVSAGLDLRRPPTPCFGVLICRWFPLVLGSAEEEDRNKGWGAWKGVPTFSVGNPRGRPRPCAPAPRGHGSPSRARSRWQSSPRSAPPDPRGRDPRPAPPHPDAADLLLRESGSLRF